LISTQILFTGIPHVGPTQLDFLPRCMECRRGLAMRMLSICLSVCLSVSLKPSA